MECKSGCFLRKEGYEVALAMDAREAMQILSHHIPDLVILDIMLPDKSGWDVCKDIKSYTSERNRFVPVILLTSLGEVDNKVFGFESGADDYLVKPPAKKELLARIRSMIRIRDLQENLRKMNSKLSHAQKIIKRDIKIVAQIQRSFLLSEFPYHPKMELAAKYTPRTRPAVITTMSLKWIMTIGELSLRISPGMAFPRLLLWRLPNSRSRNLRLESPAPARHCYKLTKN